MHDVVAVQGRERNPRDVLEAEIARKAGEVCHHGLVRVLRPTDEIHLVDGEDDVPDPEHRNEEGMPPGLPRQPLSGIDEKHREIGRRCARGHVAGVLFMPRRIGHDEGPGLRREEPIGDVDRDALLAFGRQPIHEQREIESRALRPMPPGVLLERGDLVVEDLAGVVQQSSDQGGLAVVHRAARDEAQHVLGLVGGEELVEPEGARSVVNGHQKYPSCFLRSIEDEPSWSMTRPSRSLVRASRVSRMIAGRLEALLSTAPVSG